MQHSLPPSRQAPPPAQPDLPPNPQQRWARHGLWLALVATGAALTGWQLRIEPLLIIAGVAALFLLLTALLLWRSGARLERIQTSDERLLDWRYDETEWRDLVDHLAKEVGTGARWVVLIAGVLFVVAAATLLLRMETGPALIISSLLLGVLATAVAIALWLPRRRRRGLQRAPRRLLLSREGVLIGGEFHDFQLWGSRLETVAFHRIDGSGLLKLAYSYRSRYGRQFVILEIPVPEGCEEEASTAVAQLQRPSGDHPLRGA